MGSDRRVHELISLPRVLLWDDDVVGRQRAVAMFSTANGEILLLAYLAWTDLDG
jgi:hypothetical protein